MIIFNDGNNQTADLKFYENGYYDKDGFIKKVVSKGKVYIKCVDEDGNVLPEGQVGEICIIPKSDPSLRVHIYDRARIDRSPCPCGRPAPRLVEMSEGRDCDPELLHIAAELHKWESVLDARLQRGEYGLELELVVFPGLERPKLPNCAKMVVRNWDPERDAPFWFAPLWKTPVESSEND